MKKITLFLILGIGLMCTISCSSQHLSRNKYTGQVTRLDGTPYTGTDASIARAIFSPKMHPGRCPWWEKPAAVTVRTQGEYANVTYTLFAKMNSGPRQVVYTSPLLIAWITRVAEDTITFSPGGGAKHIASYDHAVGRWVVTLVPVTDPNHIDLTGRARQE